MKLADYCETISRIFWITDKANVADIADCVGVTNGLQVYH